MHAFPLLSRMVSAEMFMRLCTLMPPPLDDSREAALARDLIGLNAIRNLGPIHTTEQAMLAVTIVAADLHTHDGFRLAIENRSNFKSVLQCRAQAMSMMRERRRAAERLERLQAMHQPDQPSPAMETTQAASCPAQAAAQAQPEPRNPPAPHAEQPDPVERAADGGVAENHPIPRATMPEPAPDRDRPTTAIMVPAVVAARAMRRMRPDTGRSMR